MTTQTNSNNAITGHKQQEFLQRILHFTLGEAKFYPLVKKLATLLKNKAYSPRVQNIIQELLPRLLHPSLLLSNKKIVQTNDNIDINSHDTKNITALVTELATYQALENCDEFTDTITQLITEYNHFIATWDQSHLDQKRDLLTTKAVLILFPANYYEITIDVAYELSGFHPSGEPLPSEEIGVHYVRKKMTPHGGLHIKTSSNVAIEPAKEMIANVFAAECMDMQNTVPNALAFVAELRFKESRHNKSSRSFFNNTETVYQKPLQISYTEDGINTLQLLKLYNLRMSIQKISQGNLHYSFLNLISALKSNDFYNKFIEEKNIDLKKLNYEELRSLIKQAFSPVLKLTNVDNWHIPDFDHIQNQILKLKVFNERFYPEALKILAFIYNWPLLALNNSIENIMKLKTELTELHPVFNDWAPEKIEAFLSGLLQNHQPRTYSSNLCFHLVIGSTDNKPANTSSHILNEHEWDSVSFDSDEYQAETIILSKDGSHYISGSTYYALLGNVESAIDPSFRQEFIRQTPEVRMLNCMASIKHWDGNLAYLVANQLVDPASFYCEDPNLDLRPKLSDELISAWQARLTSLYRGLIKSNSVTHKEILIRLSPVLYYAIETVRPKHQTDHGLDLLELFQELTSSQLVLENLLNDKLDTITLEAEDGRSNSKTTLREHLAQFKTTMLMALEFRLHHIHDAMQNYIHTLKILNDPNVSDAILTSVVVKIQAEFPLLENLRISDTKLTFLLKSVGREGESNLFAFILKQTRHNPNVKMSSNGTCLVDHLVTTAQVKKLAALLDHPKTAISQTTPHPIFLVNQDFASIIPLFVRKGYLIDTVDPIQQQTLLEMALTQERWDLFEFLVFTMRASHCNPATLFAKLDKLIDSHPKLVAQLKQLTNELGWHTKLHNLTLPINDLTNANLAIIELPHIGKRYLKPESPLSQLDTSRQQIQHFSFDAGQFDIVFDPKNPLNELSYRWLYNHLLQSLKIDQKHTSLFAIYGKITAPNQTSVTILLTEHLSGNSLIEVINEDNLLKKKGDVGQLLIVALIDLITLQIAHTPQQFIYKQNGENIEILPISNAETTNELFQTDSSGEPKILIDSVVFFLPHAKNRLLPSYYDDLCNLDFDGLLHLWLIWLKDAVEQSKAFLSNPTEQPLRTILSQSHLAFMHNVLHDIKKYAHENKGFSLLGFIKNSNKTFGIPLQKSHNLSNNNNTLQRYLHFHQPVTGRKSSTTLVAQRAITKSSQIADRPLSIDEALKYLDKLTRDASRIDECVKMLEQGNTQIYDEIMAKYRQIILDKTNIESLPAEYQAQILMALKNGPINNLKLSRFNKVDITENDLLDMLHNELHALEIESHRLNTELITKIIKKCPNLKVLSLIKIDPPRKEGNQSPERLPLARASKRFSVSPLSALSSSLSSFELIKNNSLIDHEPISFTVDQLTLSGIRIKSFSIQQPELLKLENLPELTSLTISSFDKLESVEIKSCPNFKELSRTQILRSMKRLAHYKSDLNSNNSHALLWAAHIQQQLNWTLADSQSLVTTDSRLIFSGTNISTEQAWRILRHGLDFENLYLQGYSHTNAALIIQLIQKYDIFASPKTIFFANYTSYKHSNTVSSFSNKRIEQAEFGPDDRLYYLSDEKIICYDRRSNEQTLHQDNSNKITAFTFDENGQILIAKGKNLYHLGKNKPLFALENDIQSIHVYQHYWIVITVKSQLFIRDNKNKKETFIPDIYSDIKCLAFEQDLLLIGDEAGVLTCRQLSNPEQKKAFKLHNSEFISIITMSNGSIVTVSKQDIKQWQYSPHNNHLILSGQRELSNKQLLHAVKVQDSELLACITSSSPSNSNQNNQVMVEIYNIPLSKFITLTGVPGEAIKYAQLASNGDLFIVSNSHIFSLVFEKTSLSFKDWFSQLDQYKHPEIKYNISDNTAELAFETYAENNIKLMQKFINDFGKQFFDREIFVSARLAPEGNQIKIIVGLKANLTCRYYENIFNELINAIALRFNALKNQQSQTSSEASSTDEDELTLQERLNNNQSPDPFMRRPVIQLETLVFDQEKKPANYSGITSWLKSNPKGVRRSPIELPKTPATVSTTTTTQSWKDTKVSKTENRSFLLGEKPPQNTTQDTTNNNNFST